MSIFITGDTHGSIDIKKLNSSNFPEQKKLTKNDYVIICGDFGNVWNNSQEELYWRKWLKDKNFTTLFVDGNHENFNLLNEFEVEEWNGGKVHKINDSIIHLMRGQVFTIEGKKFFTMGGATSIDRWRRTENVSWWSQEIPSKEEFDEAFTNLQKHNMEVDYVITHTTSNNIMEKLCYKKETNELNRFFDMLEQDLDYKHWYFGHFHEDIDIRNHSLLYYRIMKIL